MIHLTANAALKAIGKSTRLPEEVPARLIVREAARKFLAALRGYLRRHPRAFIHSNVRIEGRHLLLGSFSTIEEYVRINSYAKEGVQIGARTKVGAYSVISATNHLSALGKGVKIGSDCGIGEFGYIGASGGVVIGDQVIMGQYVSFHASNHVFKDSNIPIRDQGTTMKGIVVEDDVWIGAKATILDGSVIRAHSVVAAGSVVNGRFPPNVVIGGVPAKVLKHLNLK